MKTDELKVKENCNVNEIARFLAKRIRAYDGCLGIGRRRRTQKTAISVGELSTSFDPAISEWGNPAGFISCYSRMNS